MNFYFLNINMNDINVSDNDLNKLYLKGFNLDKSIIIYDNDTNEDDFMLELPDIISSINKKSKINTHRKRIHKKPSKNCSIIQNCIFNQKTTMKETIKSAICEKNDSFSLLEICCIDSYNYPSVELRDERSIKCYKQNKTKKTFTLKIMIYDKYKKIKKT